MKIPCLLSVFLAGAVAAACAPGASPSGSLAASTGAAPSSAGSAHALPTVLVYKNPACGCCRGWIQHMQRAGFPVRVENVKDLGSINQRVGVPSDAESCHTAVVGTYFIEGHVPADDVKRLLAARLPAKGLVAPGMPAGAPGMPGIAAHDPPYDVLLIALDGSTSVFEHHGG